MHTPPSPATTEPEVAYLDRWQVIRQAIRDEIISGGLEPGQVLSEGELAGRFGVSRGPVRTALQDLARVGLVVGGASRRRVAVATFDSDDIDDLYEVTMGIECIAVRSVAAYATPNDVNDLYELLAKVEGAQQSGDPTHLNDADLAFHRHIFRLSGNQRLFDLWLQIEEQVRFVIAITHRSNPGVAWARMNQPIADAIAANDPDSAEQAVVTVFHSAHDGLVKAGIFASTDQDPTRRRRGHPSFTTPRTASEPID